MQMDVPKTVAPYFWSDQYGRRLQVCGAVPAGARPHLVEGSLDSGGFVATFGDPDNPVAVVAVDGGRTFTRLRKQLDRSEDRRRTPQVVEHQ
jgi:3-phenylpropionate/trans-cinnamate dioxygenase ferredoxin reductase subunit